MQSVPEALPDNVEQLQELLLLERQRSAEKDSKIGSLEQRYQHLLEQFRLAQQRQFGRSSEASLAQLGLFNETEQAVEEDAHEQARERETLTYTRNKPKRKPLPKDLPRETVVHDIPAEDKICDCCGTELHRMGEDKSEQLEFIPARLKVIEHIRPKYSCRHCEQHGTEVVIKIAPVPATPIPKSIATASLLSQVITSKYQYALPLYRQEQLFQQYGIELSRKTLASWMLQSSQLLLGIYQRLKHIQLQQSVIYADETPLKVIHEDKSQCYMWVYCTGTDSPPNENATEKINGPPAIVLYDYQSSRSGQCAQDYLQGYSGYLQVDGYAGYEQTEATLVGCFAHARRKFVEAKKVQVKGKSGKADWVINHIGKLYRIEAEIKHHSAADKQALRQQHAQPLLQQLKSWLDKSALQVPPKSAIGKAIAYSLRQWPKLIRYIEDGYLNIDNNRAERAIKPFVIGRKNWMFANTKNGAEASAILYSLVETAKANGLMPFDYIKHLLDELPKQADSIDHLMPW
ncbi:MAG: IS66 family transposase, partial [Gammaproteobacteria bacterium]|nr:IS66 family transposase [Gammaproteobacteria bacterium]